MSVVSFPFATREEDEESTRRTASSSASSSRRVVVPSRRSGERCRSFGRFDGRLVSVVEKYHHHPDNASGFNKSSFVLIKTTNLSDRTRFYRSVYHGLMCVVTAPDDSSHSASNSLELALPRDDVGGVCIDGLKVASGL